MRKTAQFGSDRVSGVERLPGAETTLGSSVSTVHPTHLHLKGRSLPKATNSILRNFKQDSKKEVPLTGEGLQSISVRLPEDTNSVGLVVAKHPIKVTPRHPDEGDGGDGKAES